MRGNLKMKTRVMTVTALVFLLGASCALAQGKSDLVMFGGDASRNFVSDETDLPAIELHNRGEEYPPV